MSLKYKTGSCPSGILCGGVCLLLVAIAITVTSCAGTTVYSYPGHNTFVPETVGRLRTGMTAEEVRALFGPPDKEFDATFGEEVGEPWQGRVWLYFTEVDRSLRYVKRYKKSMFVFYPTGPGMKLNHWEVEA